MRTHRSSSLVTNLLIQLQVAVCAFTLVGCIQWPDDTPKPQNNSGTADPLADQHIAEGSCPTGDLWSDWDNSKVPSDIQTCLSNLDKCKSSNTWNYSLLSSEINSCDPTYAAAGSSTSGNSNGTSSNTGSQTPKSVNLLVEIINYAKNVNTYNIQSELGSSTASPAWMLATISKANPTGAIIKIPATTPYNVSFKTLSTKWYFSGAAQPLPSKKNICGNEVSHSFMEVVTRTIDENLVATYSFPLGNTGSDWGNYLVTDNPVTKSYQSSYGDNQAKDYHVSIIGIDAMSGIEEIIETNTTKTCQERTITQADRSSTGFPTTNLAGVDGQALKSYSIGGTNMHSHPIIIDLQAVGDEAQFCSAQGIGYVFVPNHIFEFISSHELGHFLLDGTGHDQIQDHLMSQIFSCKAVSSEFSQSLPYTSATLPPPGTQGSEYSTSPSLVQYCKDYPRNCKQVTAITEQKAHITYPSEDDVLRWIP